MLDKIEKLHKKMPKKPFLEFLSKLRERKKAKRIPSNIVASGNAFWEDPQDQKKFPMK